MTPQPLGEKAKGLKSAFERAAGANLSTNIISLFFSHPAGSISSFRRRGEFAAAVGSAMTANAVRHRRLATIRARGWIHRPQRIVGAALIAFGTRGAALRCLHNEIFPGVCLYSELMILFSGLLSNSAALLAAGRDLQGYIRNHLR
jgi:hypothetical protein